MTTKLIPERGWRPMVDAYADPENPIIVRYHEHNKPSGPVRVQLAQYLPNPYGEWAWRPAYRCDGGTVHANGWMTLSEFNTACKELTAEATPEFDL